MNRATIVLIMGMLVAAPLTGCIENMDDLKDRISGAQSDGGDDVDPLNQSLDGNSTNDTVAASGNQTIETKDPVARVTVYAPGGALLYRASFVAEDQQDPVMGEVGTYNLLAAESEALEPSAKLETFEWVVDGQKYDGRKASVEFTEPGIHMITLTVTDSYGKTDSQMVHVGVMPQPFDVVTPFNGGQMAGFWTSDPVGDNTLIGGPHTYEITVLDEVDGKSVTAQRLSLSLSNVSQTSLWPDMRLYDAEGNQVATGGTSINVDNPDAGTYTLEVRMDGATESYDGRSVVTYLEEVEGLGGDDGHGGHAH